MHDRPALIQFTSTELELLKRLAEGKPYRSIAAELHLSPATIAYHATRLRGRLRASNNIALVASVLLLGVFVPNTWPPRLSGRTSIERVVVVAEEEETGD